MPDPDRLARIHAACFTVPRPWPAHEIEGLMGVAGVFVVEEDGGFLMARAIAGEAEILTVAVHPDQRRQGIAKRLMQRFIAESRLRQAERAFLEVAENNAPAIALYEHEGFVTNGRRKGYFTKADGRSITALLMTRDL